MDRSPNRHECMLPKQPDCLYYAPTAGFFKKVACRIRLLSQAASWHSGTATFIRSQKSLAMENKRQAAASCCIIHPYSAIRFHWDCFTMLVTVVCFIYAPLQVFVTCPDPLDPLLLFMDVVAFMDILLNFITGIESSAHQSLVERHIVLDPKTIATLYIKDRFIWDLISALPLQVIQPLPYNCMYPTHTTFLILKLFRIKSFCRAWKTLCHQTGMSYVTAVASTVMLQVSAYVHWLTYIHYQVMCICKHYHGETAALNYWLYVLNLHHTKTHWLEEYVANFYRVFAISLGTAAYDPTHERLIEEMVLVPVLGIIGLFTLGHCLTTTLRLIFYHRYESLLFSGRQQDMNEYLRLKRLPPTLQQKVQLYISYKFNGRYFNERFIMDTINDQIKQEINMFNCKRLVGAVPLFRDLPVAIINTIVFSLTQVLYMPGEVIVKCGNPGKSLYMIASGTVAVMNSKGIEVGHLKDGASWGERALLQPGVLRSITVVALEITEIYKISSRQFLSCLQPAPRLKRRLMETLRNRTKRRDQSPPPTRRSSSIGPKSEDSDDSPARSRRQ